VHTYNTKKSGTITGKATILEPQFQTNIWVASVDATQKKLTWHGISDLAAEEKQVSSNQSGSRTNTFGTNGCKSNG